jgi:hypothetical protein
MEDNLEKACEDYDSERDISGLAGGAYGHYLADRLMYEKSQNYLEEKAELEDKSELESKLNFIKTVKNMNINPDDLFSGRDAKEKLIREYKGYIRLNRLGQKRKENQKGKLLSQCSDEKIGSVFKNIYYSTLKELKK